MKVKNLRMSTQTKSVALSLDIFLSFFNGIVSTADTIIQIPDTRKVGFTLPHSSLIFTEKKNLIDLE